MAGMPAPLSKNARKKLAKQTAQQTRRARQPPETRAAAEALRLQNQANAARHKEQADAAEEAAWAARLNSPPIKNPEQAVIPLAKILEYMLKGTAKHARQFESMGFKLSQPGNTPEEEAEVQKQVEDIESQVRAQLLLAPCYARPLPQGDTLSKTAELQQEAKQKQIDFGSIVNTPMLIQGPKAARYCMVSWIFRRSPPYSGHEESFGSLITMALIRFGRQLPYAA